MRLDVTNGIRPTPVLFGKVGQTSSEVVGPRGCSEGHLRQIPNPIEHGEANLIEDDKFKGWAIVTP